MKRLISLMFALLLLTALSTPAMAETWGTADFTMEVPDDMYRLGPDLSEEDPAWALAGVADAASRIQEFQEMGTLVNFVSKDGKTSISIMQRENDYAQKVYDLALLTPEELEQVLADLPESNNENLTVSKDWYQPGERLFYRVQLDMVGESEMHELLYGTIINGYALNIDVYGGKEEITAEQQRMLEEMVGSMQFTRISEKPQAEPVDAMSTILLLVLLLIAIVAPLIYIPVRSKRDKKQKAKLAEQLSEYHKTHGANQAEGQSLFHNDTDCTKEAIHQFSFYQAYVKNIGELSFGCVMCLVMVAAAFLFETEWWMKLLAAGITVYYAYKIISMPGAVEKVQRKVFGRGPSQTAHYTFYPEVFRVSGIQSTSVVPYFQITDVRRKGQYLYLYYGPDNAYMVDMYGFSKGEPEEFVKFIGERIGRKK